jgi:hypothetical protein
MNEVKLASQPTRLADSTLVSLVALLDGVILNLLILAAGPLAEKGWEIWSYIESILKHFFVHTVIGAAALGGVSLCFAHKPRFISGSGPRLAAVTSLGWITVGSWFYLSIELYISADTRAEKLALGPGTIAAMWVLRTAAIKFMNRGVSTQAVPTQGTGIEPS